MADVKVDNQLTAGAFLVPGAMSEFAERSSPLLLSLEPGTYRFLQRREANSNFEFYVTSQGKIDYDQAHDAYLDGRGSDTLVVRGVPVLIDGTRLSHALFPKGFGSASLSSRQVHALALLPSRGYAFASTPEMSDVLRFDVAPDGSVTLDPEFRGIAEVHDGILRIDGFRITIDTHGLSHSLLPLIPGYDGGELTPGQHVLNVLPSPAGYTFISASGVSTDFSFVVGLDGRVSVDPQFSKFAEASGQTLRIRGYDITIDTTALSHALLPLLLGWPGNSLPPGRNQLTIVPGAIGYLFITASGIVADFSLLLKAEGLIVVDPRFAGFAESSGRTLTIKGYRVTLDTQALSHSLLPLLLGWPGNELAPGRNDLTVVPSVIGYSFIVASGVSADFTLVVTAEGTVVIGPRFAGFAKVDGRTLKLHGYGVRLDTSELATAVVPLLLGWSGGALPPGLHSFSALPAANYELLPTGGRLPPMSFSLRTDGTMTLLNAPAGTILTSDLVFCAVPDNVVTPIQIQTYGSPKGRWSHGQLTWSVDLTNAPALGDGVVVHLLIDCFSKWQQVVPEFFSFQQVAVRGDIHVAFGGPELEARFADPKILGRGQYPEAGKLSFNKAETWTPTLLQEVTLHELGHVLGLQHSTDPDSIMYSTTNSRLDIDAESRDALRNLYTWRPQISLSDRATSDRPAMASTSRVNLTSLLQTFHMVWKGSRDDQSVYQSTFENDMWTLQTLVSGIGSSHSPALAEFPLNDGRPSTGLIMAWTGAGDDDNLYYATNAGDGWGQQSIVPNVGSSVRPALALFDVPVLAWKGARGDGGIYWSRLTATGWEPQRNVPGVGTSHSPALVFFQNKLYMFWKGSRDDHLVYFSTLDSAPGAEWRPQQVVQYPDAEAGGTTFINIASNRGPSATLHGNRIMLAWKGLEGDTSIWFSLYDGNQFTGQIAVAGVGTSEGPCVFNFKGFTHMVWKGVDPDTGIWWSKLASPQ
jgi:hypothetical protein